MSPTLRSQTHGHEPIIVEKNNGREVLQRGYGERVESDIVGTITTKEGLVRGDTKLILEKKMTTYAIAGNVIGRQSHNGGNGNGFKEEVMYTLDTIVTFGIMQDVSIFDRSTRAREPQEQDGVSPTLQANMGTGGGNEPMLCQNAFEHHPQDSRVKQTEVAPTCGVFGNSIEGKDCLIQNGTNVTDFKGNNESENCIIDMQGGKSGANTRTDGTCPTLTVPGHDSASCVHAVASSKLSVRRLLPIECERLMGFPDNWTKIPWRGKPSDECPDAPRYKACGNSMGVNCMRWIGLGIQAVEDKYATE